MMYKSEFLSILFQRGFIYQVTHAQELDEACARQKIRAYWGCDATASSLHVGNLMGLMVMRWLQETGHTPVMLVGGGTTKIGDPSGRDATRKLLTEDQISQNIQGIKKCFEKVISFTGPDGALLVDNAQWLDQLALIPFLREIGCHFSINRMLTFESVKSRLDREYPLSYIEFSYMLLQAYDFLELQRRHACHLQVGGSDQWGNIVSGVDLVRRVAGQPVYGLTWPLLQTASGAKMGKTAEGALWLDEALVSPYAYWQFWRNTEDEDVVRFLKLYTMMPLKEIEDFSHLTGRELSQAKIVLADHATAFLHGPGVLPSIHHTVQQAFSGTLEDSSSLCLPTFEVDSTQLEEGLSCLHLLKELGFVVSGREGRQKIREGAISLQGQVIHDELYRLTAQDFQKSSVIQLSLGTKKHALIRRAPSL